MRVRLSPSPPYLFFSLRSFYPVNLRSKFLRGDSPPRHSGRKKHREMRCFLRLSFRKLIAWRCRRWRNRRSPAWTRRGRRASRRGRRSGCCGRRRRRWRGVGVGIKSGRIVAGIEYLLALQLAVAPNFLGQGGFERAVGIFLRGNGPFNLDLPAVGRAVHFKG